MNITFLKSAGLTLLLMVTVATCAPIHPGGELVEQGVIRAEIKDTDDFHIQHVWVHADAEGTHIHGELHRRMDAKIENDHGHVEVTLLDRNGAVLYQGTMQPSIWSFQPRYRKGVLHDETFHVIAQVPPPEQGTVRVVYHPGPEHDITKP